MLILLPFLFGFALGAEFTLPGQCPKVRIQSDLDHTKFSGTWYNVAGYASDGRRIYDCATMEFQEDNLGYTLKETYIDIDDTGNRTQKSYFARVDPTFDANGKAHFIVSHEHDDKILQFVFYILTTNYDNYAIAYTCNTFKKRPAKHYVYAWVLSRHPGKLEGEALLVVENALKFYPELSQHRSSFVHKDFSEDNCRYDRKMLAQFFTNNFWDLSEMSFYT